MTLEMKVGFVGLGNMGAPMSANIARAGGHVIVYDTDPQRARIHAETIGATVAASAAELGAAADIVVLMLPTSRIVAEVVLTGTDNLCAGMTAGKLVIDMSSSDPNDSIKLAAALADRHIAFVDAPVSGAVPRAKDGTLTIMAGAANGADLDRALPILTAMGNKVVPTGGIGSGHAMKALNNYCAAAGFACASEALILAERFGIAREVALDIINTSTGRNFSTESTIKNQVLTEAYASGFGLALLAKDVAIAAQMAKSIGAEMPLVATANGWWQTALDAEGGAKDHTTAYRAWRART